jgi:hypothetical protein
VSSFGEGFDRGVCIAVINLLCRLVVRALPKTRGLPRVLTPDQAGGRLLPQGEGSAHAPNAHARHMEGVPWVSA